MFLITSTPLIVLNLGFYGQTQGILVRENLEGNISPKLKFYIIKNKNMFFT